MHDEDRRIVAWLKSLPANAVIEWVDDHIIAEHAWCGSWVDVRVPDAQSDLQMNWIWTIVGPDWPQERVPGVLWEFVVDYDLDLYSVHDPEPPNYWYVKEIPVPWETALSAEQDAELDRILAEGPNRTRDVHGAWSPNAISDALRGWVSTHADRGDLIFKWNPDLGPSKMTKAAEEAIKAIQAGREEGYDLGDNVWATDQVMDFLLGVGPEKAAKITEEFKRIIGTKDGES